MPAEESLDSAFSSTVGRGAFGTQTTGLKGAVGAAVSAHEGVASLPKVVAFGRNAVMPFEESFGARASVASGAHDAVFEQDGNMTRTFNDEERVRGIGSLSVLFASHYFVGVISLVPYVGRGLGKVS